MIFKCKNCGGNILYNPEKGTMCCPHCESLESEDKLVSTEYMVSCANCGAPMDGAIKQFTSATKCLNCGTYVILDERVEGDLRPEFVLPFRISRNKAIDLLRDEFGKRIFTPSAFLNKASVDKIEGSYIPFFMYDYDTYSRYQGVGTKVRTWTSGGYEYTETSYYDIYREMKADFDMVPVDASDAMEDGLMDLLEPFNYAGLEQFNEKYMSGFMGEMYNQPEEALAPRAIDKIAKAVDGLLNGSISGYSTVTKVNKNTDLKKKNVHYALLPVWEYVFSFRGVDYKFHVNGETGKVVGRTPVDKQKVVAFSGTVFALVSIIGMAIRFAMAYL
ncbi:MAG: hypothetical protein KBS96_03510 [Lachnospiraceae bacterium]|nr:hypothetical protein [Candidatus Colinaster scatohippi]